MRNNVTPFNPNNKEKTMTDRIAEGTMVSLLGGAALGFFPYILAIPAAAYYSVKTYQLLKGNK